MSRAGTGVGTGRVRRERSLYDDDIYVSPILERTPSWSGTRWTRFFPELSSHFSLVSPVSSRHQSLDGACKSGAPSIISNISSIRESLAESDSTVTTTGTSWLWSDELVDDIDAASSCYSRRSSLTSLGSEASASAYKSADAFSIISPSIAGVFDDPVSVYRSDSNMSKVSVKNLSKPLPSEPPIQLAPLSIRRKKKQSPVTSATPTIHEETRDGILDSMRPAGAGAQQLHDHGKRHHPTLSQAAEELENALAGLVVERNSGDSEDLPRIDAPLQVRRGNMDMIATRPAPSPPRDASRVTKSSKAKASPSPDEEMNNAKKRDKGRASSGFSFSVAVPGLGFGWKSHLQLHRPHLRSLSGSSVAALERRKSHDALTAITAATKRNENESVGSRTSSSSLLSAPVPPQRPASVNSERELRMKLPRLQTKTKEEQQSSAGGVPPALASPADPVAAAEDDAPLQIEVLQPKPRKTFSFEAEGTMTKMKTKSKSKNAAAGPYEMEADSRSTGSRRGQETIYELEAGFPAQQIKTPVATTPFVPSGEMPRTLPDEIVVMILRQCSSLPDLFSFAVMNRQFYRVFKGHELELIKNTVFQMSPPAWELREMSPPWDNEWQVLFDLDAPVPEYTPSLYLDRYTQDLYTLVKLKSLILARCGTFLRPETVRGLAGVDDDRAAEIDDAFWRVWAFCRIFGCGKGREGDVLGQLDWLNGGVVATNQHSSVAMSISEPFGMNNVLFEPPEGFGRGNQGGLSHAQLYDMTEIWTCLGVLLQPIHGKCEEARRAGVLNGHDVPAKDPAKEEAILGTEEWTSYILTLGPSAVLALGSIATVDNGNEIFQRAQSMGLTKWDSADASRAIFFREAVSKAYKSRESTPRVSASSRQTGSNSSRSSASSHNRSHSRNDTASSSNSINTNTTDEPHRRRQAAYAAQLRNRRHPINPSYAEERPISSYNEIMSRLAGAPSHPLYRPDQSAPPVPSLPSSFSSSSSQHSSSNRPTQPTNPPHPIQVPYSAPPPSRPRAPRGPVFPQIRDPADQAIDMMVRELGFNVDDAKWALKITDTGEGVNPNAAVSLLIQEYQRHSYQPVGGGNGAYQYGYSYAPPTGTGHGQGQRNNILSAVMHSQEAAGGGGWQWA
ncbi:uncharacterized protein BDV17DRAFT_282581 [Aspergillus undulatus]|uniref:uncharacterized protein n=1 Tax=Aspergillus undulatus TaxID=1810928 RepID=UPI003CCDCBEB